jgi:hypothetical protein
MSGLIRNNWESRKRIREQLRIDLISDSTIQPVLLIYWTKESLNQFLIPATPEEFMRLDSLHGVDENGTGWEPLKENFEWLKNKISYKYEDGDGDKYPEGQWRERYFIDTHDDEGKSLTPIIAPPGTTVIITGYIQP